MSISVISLLTNSSDREASNVYGSFNCHKTGHSHTGITLLFVPQLAIYSHPYILYWTLDWCDSHLLICLVHFLTLTVIILLEDFEDYFFWIFYIFLLVEGEINHWSIYTEIISILRLTVEFADHWIFFRNLPIYYCAEQILSAEIIGSSKNSFSTDII